MSTQGYEHLLSPITICGKTYRNRVGTSPMSFTNDRQREADSLWTSNRTNEYEYYGVMTAEEQAVYDSYLADMCTFISEKYVGYITGNEPLENFEANVEQLYSMGLQEMMDAKQAAYDRYMGK